MSPPRRWRRRISRRQQPTRRARVKLESQNLSSPAHQAMRSAIRRARHEALEPFEMIVESVSEDPKTIATFDTRLSGFSYPISQVRVTCDLPQGISKCSRRRFRKHRGLVIQDLSMVQSRVATTGRPLARYE